MRLLGKKVAYFYTVVISLILLAILVSNLSQAIKLIHTVEKVVHENVKSSFLIGDLFSLRQTLASITKSESIFAVAVFDESVSPPRIVSDADFKSVDLYLAFTWQNHVFYLDWKSQGIIVKSRFKDSIQGRAYSKVILSSLPLGPYFLLFLVFAIASTALHWIFTHFYQKSANRIIEPLERLENDLKQINIAKDFNVSNKQLSQSNIAEIRSLARIFKSEFLKNQRLVMEIQELKVSEAIGKTTQMLAHDVRRPFSMLEAVVNLMENAPPGEAQAIARKYAPEVKGAVTKVNGMLEDILNVNGHLNISSENLDLETLVSESLKEVFSFSQGPEINFEYDFTHTHQIQVDRSKTLRVFINIISNAKQAMEGQGTIAFSSQEVDGQLELTIGNSGSYIPPENQETLFEAFFTKGKKNGTGLGLAIAKRIIQAQGGRIWCESSKENGTRFILTLPLSQSKTNCQIELAQNSSKLLFKQGKKPIRKLPRKRFYCLVDDSFLVREDWMHHAPKDNLMVFNSPEDFFQSIESEAINFGQIEAVITDQNFDETSESSGLDLAEKIRRREAHLPIYLASDANLEPETLSTLGVIPVSKSAEDGWQAVLKHQLH